MRSAIAVLITAFLFVGNAQAQECNFPDAVPISADMANVTALQDTFIQQCPSLADYQPWTGFEVVDTGGNSLGVTGDLLVSVGGYDPKLFIEVLASDDTTRFAVTLPGADVGDRFDLSAFVLSPADELAPYITGDAVISEGTATQVLPVGQLGASGVASLVAATSANPYPSRMIVRFESSPESAAVTVGNSRVGPTTTQAWVAKDALPRIVLSLDGYRACRFEDGLFREPTISSSALFYCTLVEE